MGLTSKPLRKEVQFSELNEVQLGLLRMFARPMSEEQTVKLKRAIVGFLSDELEKEVEKAVAAKNITEEDYEALKHQHQRTANESGD